jgi:ribosomal protein S18 acetylase RimI-like enzyme
MNYKKSKNVLIIKKENRLSLYAELEVQSYNPIAIELYKSVHYKFKKEDKVWSKIFEV